MKATMKSLVISVMFLAMGFLVQAQGTPTPAPPPTPPVPVTQVPPTQISSTQVIYNKIQPFGNFGDPITTALSHIFNIFFNMAVTEGGGTVNGLLVMFVNMLKDILDALGAVFAVLTNLPISPEAIAKSADNVDRFLKDLNDMFTQLSSENIPVEIVPFLPLLKVPLMIGIPLVDHLAKFLHAGGQATGEIPFIGNIIG